MAFKIFELGLKKYGDIPEYILAYIDYLSHLNGRLSLVRRFPKAVSLLVTGFVKRRGTNKGLSSSTLQRITTPGFCLNASSLQETCLQKSPGNVRYSSVSVEATRRWEVFISSLS